MSEQSHWNVRVAKLPSTVYTVPRSATHCVTEIHAKKINMHAKPLITTPPVTCSGCVCRCFSKIMSLCMVVPLHGNSIRKYIISFYVNDLNTSYLLVQKCLLYSLDKCVYFDEMLKHVQY